MQHELKEDNTLWRRFKEGNEHSFYLLYDQYADNLYKYGIHFTKDKDFIKDCIHDLFLDLFKYRKKLSDTDNIQFYLFRSLRRIIHKQQAKVIPLVYDEMYNSANDNPIFSHEEYLIAAETESENLTALNEAMKRLSDRQREALSLKFENDRSYSDIAEIMEISIESARTLVYRALKELRKCFKNECQFIQVLFFLYRHPNP
ncbi:MAG TPA: sigma-70 family RNA polymerase sigma factor [Prolixibacteraceae bacterium]|nr:sigma-70 family RNA polymerase sigma factor [Prolixibacteraceae bacterium]